jgi:hypothetical protein
MKKLFNDLIKQLIEVGRSETIPDNPKYRILNDGWWQRRRYPKSEDFINYSYEELKSLFKGVVLCEKEFNWQVGRLTNTNWIFRNLIERPEYSENYPERKELYEFGFANKIDNPYVSEDSGLSSGYRSYEVYLKVKSETEIEDAKRSARMRQIHLASKELATVRKQCELKAKEKRMIERAERKKERDRNILIIEYN